MRKLHIGGTIPKEGWEIFNSQPEAYVDYVGDASNLKRFPDETFDIVYASHILEHFDGRSIVNTLKEWGRVLKNDGKLYISVTDLDVICKMFLDKNIGVELRVKLIKFIYGAHDHPDNYHYFGFDLDILVECLKAAGFQQLIKTQTFGIFNDTSELLICGVPVSLNVVVYKHPKKRKEQGKESYAATRD